MKARGIALPVTFGLLIIGAVAALCIGPYPIAPWMVLRVMGHAVGLGSAPGDAVATTVVLDARLPRAIAAILVGSGLSLSGGAYQAVFRNPLVSPGLLGVLAGAGLGAAVAILLGLPAGMRMALTAAGGIAAVGVGVAIATMFGRSDEGGMMLLVFGGLISTALFTALLSLVKFAADPAGALPDIVFWLLGSLAAVTPPQLMDVAPPLLVGIALLLYAGRFLDILVLSDDEANSLGVPARRMRLAIVAVATVTCALTVAIAGTIGWVGLVVPHVARLIVGPAHRRLMPVAASLGALFLLVADTLARTVSASEIPIGIITDLIGVFAFLIVLPRVRRGWA